MSHPTRELRYRPGFDWDGDSVGVGELRKGPCGAHVHTHARSGAQCWECPSESPNPQQAWPTPPSWGAHEREKQCVSVGPTKNMVNFSDRLREGWCLNFLSVCPSLDPVCLQPQTSVYCSLSNNPLFPPHPRNPDPGAWPACTAFPGDVPLICFPFSRPLLPLSLLDLVPGARAKLLPGRRCPLSCTALGAADLRDPHSC